MLFSKKDIEGFVNVVDLQMALFSAENLGVDVLTEYDKYILSQAGIDLEELEEGFTPFEQSFLFGRLVNLLGDDNTKKLDYDDFRSYINSSSFLPLSDLEKRTLDASKRRTYGHIRGLEEGMKSYVEGVILDNETKKRADYEKVIHDAVERANLHRSSVKAVISEIGNKTQDWQRDLGRIADTEMNSVYQEGIATKILEEDGEDAEVYKDVYNQACRHCIRLYLTGGLGSEPRTFKISELIANGTNVGKKVQDWKATVGSTHPWCRCQLRRKLKDDIWDEETKSYKPKPYKSKRTGVEGLIEVEVGKHKFKA